MKHFYLNLLPLKKLSVHGNEKKTLLALFAFSFLTIVATAQTQPITQYVLFAGAGGAGTAVPPSPGYTVQLASGASVQGGIIGSVVLVNTTGNATVSGTVNSGGKVTFGNNNTII